ncbi:MAG: sulfurtransferase TusA family protein [Cyanobacteria bacterium SBLK]|nr:sulfurtransferase TusA family protein [Cyanobacteria bacterium SBLK]
MSNEPLLANNQHFGFAAAEPVEVQCKQPTTILDLRGTPCPINFVRTKLHLEQMESGELLEVWLDRGEPIEQVPDSLVMAGYVIEVKEDRSEYFALQVRS